jgi:hypothetical protein
MAVSQQDCLVTLQVRARDCKHVVLRCLRQSANRLDSSTDIVCYACSTFDVAGYSDDMPDLGATRLLMVPSNPTSHARVIAGVDAWLLVEKSAVSMDGRVCNKIGTSYTAFRQQSAACDSVAGTCLSNQLEDLQRDDEMRISSGLPPRNRISAFGRFAAYADASSGAQYVAYTVASSRNSLVTLTIDADAIRFVVAESTGQIVSLAVEEFETQSNQGWLLARVINTGEKTADFSIRIDCTLGILDHIEARQVSLMADESRGVSFQLHALHQNASQHVCIAYLYGSRQTLLSTRNVSFTTTARVEDRGAQSGDLVPSLGHSEFHDNALSDGWLCETLCPNFFDVPCFIALGCGSKLARFFLVFGGILLLCCCCCFAAASRTCRRVLCCCSLFECSPPNQKSAPYFHSGRGYADRSPPRLPARRPSRSWQGREWVEARSAPCGKCSIPTHRATHASSLNVSTIHRSARRLNALRTMRQWSQGPQGHPPAERGRSLAYMNIAGDHAAAAMRESYDSWLRPTGPEFSLQGSLITLARATLGTDSSPVTIERAFCIGPDCHQLWQWRSHDKTYEAQIHPTRLNRSFFRVALSKEREDKLRALMVLTESPKFMCINSKLQHDHQKAAWPLQKRLSCDGETGTCCAVTFRETPTCTAEQAHARRWEENRDVADGALSS